MSKLEKEKMREIVSAQKKSNAAFREKVKKLIEIYSKEFNIPFLINLRLGVKSKTLGDFKLKGYGINIKATVQIQKENDFLKKAAAFFAKEID